MPNKKKVIIYALGEYWKENINEISSLYEIIACSDQNKKAIVYAKEYLFISPDEISKFSYDKIILCCKRRGVRETLILKYNISAEKIYYWKEIFEYKREKKIINYREQLTIIIPTYNRKKRLKRTLKILELQSDKNFGVIILDNNSNYSIEELCKEIDDDLRNRIKVVHNKVNIGMAANLANAFIQQLEGWVWMLSDDDIPSVYAVEDIHEEIENRYSIGAINFPIYDISKKIIDNGKDFKSLHEILDFYRHIILNRADEARWSGDFIFFSNKVYNTDYLKKFYQQIFTYAYSGVPQLIPILFMLNEKICHVRISTKKIVEYEVPDGDHWNWTRTILGMRIITDFYLDIDEKDRNMLYRLIMNNCIDYLIEEIHKETMEYDIKQIEKIYNEVYCYSFSETEKLDYKMKINMLKRKMLEKV